MGSHVEQLGLRRNPGLLRRFLSASLITFVALGAIANWFEHTTVGKRLTRASAASLSDVFAWGVDPLELPVAVIDISAIERSLPVDRRTVQESELVTPADPIIAILNALDSDVSRPAAIGIDIDLSPDGSEIDPEHYKLLSFCLEYSKRVPVFVGVVRGLERSPGNWLGLPKFAPLAASAVGIRRQPELYPSAVGLRAYGSPLPTLGTRLAGAHHRGEMHAKSSVLIPFSSSVGGEDLGIPEHLQIDTVHPIDMSIYLSRSEWTISDVTFTTDGDRPVASVPRSNIARDRIVLIGDAGPNSEGGVYDGMRVPGVYFHACAAYTLGWVPVRMLKASVAPFVDAGLWGAGLAIVSIFAWRRTRKIEALSSLQVHPHRLAKHLVTIERETVQAEREIAAAERRVRIATSVVLLCGALALAYGYHLLWPQCVFLAMALLIEGRLSMWVTRFLYGGREHA